MKLNSYGRTYFQSYNSPKFTLVSFTAAISPNFEIYLAGTEDRGENDYNHVVSAFGSMNTFKLINYRELVLRPHVHDKSGESYWSILILKFNDS